TARAGPGWRSATAPSACCTTTSSTPTSASSTSAYRPGSRTRPRSTSTATSGSPANSSASDVTAWREDFENVSPGDVPALWMRANNAWEKDSGVVEGQAAQGKRCLRLFGSLEKFFSGDVLIALPPRVPFTLRLWIRQGDERPKGPTHA